MQYNQLRTTRILSIDALRGITILCMIFVNELAGVRDIPQWLKHMPKTADAMSFPDIVFPSFLFIVGMSIPFAINSRLAKGDNWWQLQQHILFRTLGLLVLGVFMVNAEGHYNQAAMPISISLWALLFYAAIFLIWKVYRTTPQKFIYLFKALGTIVLIVLAYIYRGGEDGTERLLPHWWGILGLIGWAYICTCLFYQLFRGNKWLLLAAIVFCIAFYCFGYSNFVQDADGLDWITSQSSNAAHTSIVLCGLVVTLIFFDEQKKETINRRYMQAIVLTVLFLLAAYVLRPFYKISKVYATPSWCLYCAAICTIVFMFLHWLIDIKHQQRWTVFFQPAAANPLLAYIIPDIIFYLTAGLGISLLPGSLRYGIIGVIWSAFFAIAVLGIVQILNRFKIKLHL